MSAIQQSSTGQNEQIMAPNISQLPHSLIPLGYMETEHEGVLGRVSSTTQSRPLRVEGSITSRPLYLYEGSSISI